MLKIAHKYIRRVIVWLNMPSQEELDAREDRRAKRQAERETRYQEFQRDRVLRALQYRPLPGEYAAFNLVDLRHAEIVVRGAAETGLCCESFATEHLDAIKRIANAKALEPA